MDVDVAVLGGGPGGYTAAIRVAQLGAKVACIDKEPELGGTCLRVGCIPTKAWVQTAFALKQAEESFAKFGVQTSGTTLDFAASNDWKAGVVKQMTQGVAGLFKANGVEWVKGAGRFSDANTIAVEGGESVSFKQAIVATGSFPLRPPIPVLDSPRCVDSTGLLAQTELPRPIYTEPEIAAVGLTEAEAREQYGDDVAVGRFPWVANARAVMQDETVGWVKSIHETRYGELLGLVMVGPHVTALVEAGVVAL